MRRPVEDSPRSPHSDHPGNPHFGLTPYGSPAPRHGIMGQASCSEVFKGSPQPRAQGQGTPRPAPRAAPPLVELRPSEGTQVDVQVLRNQLQAKEKLGGLTATLSFLNDTCHTCNSVVIQAGNAKSAV